MANDSKDTYLTTVKTDIRGNTEFAKTINPGTHFLKFCQLFRKVMRHLTRITEGTIDPSWRLFKLQLLKLCLQDSSRTVEKFASLQMLPNGDWQQFGIVEVIVPIGSKFDPERVVDVTVEGSCSVLCGARMTRWKEERWEGADKPWSEWLLMEGINGLGTLTLIAFNLQRKTHHWNTA
jgi:hypothetical protein